MTFEITILKTAFPEPSKGTTCRVEHGSFIGYCTIADPPTDKGDCWVLKMVGLPDSFFAWDADAPDRARKG